MRLSLSLFTSCPGIDVVFRRLPILGIEEETRLTAYKASQSILTSTPPTLSLRLLRTKDSLRQAVGDWKEFISSPVFPSSLSISLLYLSVLSFDGAMLSYLKSHGFGDAFLAGMRGVCVVTGLLGTVRIIVRLLSLVRKEVLIDSLSSGWNANSGETNRSRTNWNLQYFVRSITPLP